MEIPPGALCYTSHRTLQDSTAPDVPRRIRTVVESNELHETNTTETEIAPW